MKAQWWSRISWRALKLRWVNLASLKYILSTFCFSEFPCRGGSDKKIQNDLCRFYRSYYYLELWSVFAETLIACFGYIPICVEEGFACSNICVVWQYIPRSLLKYFFWFTADISSDYKKTWYARYHNPIGWFNNFYSSAKKCRCRYPDENRREDLSKTVNLGNTDTPKEFFYVREI